MSKSDDWLAQVNEEVLEPELPIVDPHHHLWTYDPPGAYLIEDLWADTGSGHCVEQTVFIQCGAEPRKDGPKEMRFIGETEFVVAQAAKSERGPRNAARIRGIVAFADLTLGARVDAVLGVGQVEVLAAVFQGGAPGCRQLGRSHDCATRRMPWR